MVPPIVLSLEPADRSRHRRACVAGRDTDARARRCRSCCPATTLPFDPSIRSRTAVDTPLPEITFPSSPTAVPPFGLTPIQLDEAPSAMKTPSPAMPSGIGPGHVGPDEIARDDVAVGAGADDVDTIVVAPRDDVALAGVIDAAAVGADPVAGGASVDHHSAADDVAVVVSKPAEVPLSRATSPVTLVPMKLPATALPSVPWPLIQTPANRLPLRSGSARPRR